MENKPRHRASLDDSKSTGLVPPGKLFSGGQIPKSPSGSLCRLNPNNVLKPVPDSDTAKTNLDSESESDMPVTWSEITKTSILLTVSDDQEDNIVEPSPKKQPRSKRSPNRDDSDSDDEDDNGNKIIKPKVEDTEFNPETDHQYLNSGFKVGFAEDRNKKYRRTMEDSHTICYDFGGTIGSGFFAVFDGHAGRTAADFCGDQVHKIFQSNLKSQHDTPIPNLLHETFLQVDKLLSQKKGLHSGCTAIVGFIREEQRKLETGELEKKRVLYTANAGDARAVLSRHGNAVRLSYDHKGSDVAENRRIVEAGGFVMNNRVNGVLAVTRSLGDLSMKEWVIGSPYTTETVLTAKDDLLILACDGIWDVCSDQGALELIKDIKDPQEAADCLVDYALDNFSTDNLTVVVVRLNSSFT